VKLEDIYLIMRVREYRRRTKIAGVVTGVKKKEQREKSKPRRPRERRKTRRVEEGWWLGVARERTRVESKGVGIEKAKGETRYRRERNVTHQPEKDTSEPKPTSSSLPTSSQLA